MASQLVLMMRSTAPTKKPCTERLYSAITINAFDKSSIRLPPVAMLKSITEIVCPRICATPRTNEFNFGIEVSGGHWSTSRTLNTLIPKR